jgi:hypothetical protein
MSGILRKLAPVGNQLERQVTSIDKSLQILFRRKRFRRRSGFSIMTPVFPLAHTEAPRRFEDERLMMEILRGSPALSAFRINKLLARFQAANLPVSNIYAEYVHFADLNAP